jgi:hypothetical protein
MRGIYRRVGEGVRGNGKWRMENGKFGRGNSNDPSTALRAGSIAIRINDE